MQIAKIELKERTVIKTTDGKITVTIKDKKVKKQGDKVVNRHDWLYVYTAKRDDDNALAFDLLATVLPDKAIKDGHLRYQTTSDTLYKMIVAKTLVTKDKDDKDEDIKKFYDIFKIDDKSTPILDDEN